MRILEIFRFLPMNQRLLRIVSMSIVPCIVLCVLGLVVPRGREREEVSLVAERSEYLQPVGDAFVRESVDDELGNAFLGPEG